MGRRTDSHVVQPRLPGARVEAGRPARRRAARQVERSAGHARRAGLPGDRRGLEGVDAQSAPGCERPGEVARDPQGARRSFTAGPIPGGDGPGRALIAGNAALVACGHTRRLATGAHRAAQSLAALPLEAVRDDRDKANLEAAVAEFFTAMSARPDDWASHANLGNFHMERRDFDQAIREFETATKLEPRVVGPLVNASLAYSNLNQPDRAEAALRQALKVEPNNASALFNLGLLLAETGRTADAVKSLRSALEFDPRMAQAAYNLGVIAGASNKAEAVRWCLKAYTIEPGSGKYAHALAFYQRESGDLASAVATLRKWLDGHPLDAEAVLELGLTYVKRGDRAAALSLYRSALANERIPDDQRTVIAREVQRLGASTRP